MKHEEWGKCARTGPPAASLDKEEVAFYCADFPENRANFILLPGKYCPWYGLLD